AHRRGIPAADQGVRCTGLFQRAPAGAVARRAMAGLSVDRVGTDGNLRAPLPQCPVSPMANLGGRRLCSALVGGWPRNFLSQYRQYRGRPNPDGTHVRRRIVERTVQPGWLRTRRDTWRQV